MARNDGWRAAGLERQVDAVIGAGWLLAAQPDAKRLGIDPEEAEDLADQIEAAHEDYANDVGFYCDAGRRGPLSTVLALAFRHRVSQGEAFGSLMWLPRGGRYATAMMVVDPDRVSNPRNAPNTAGLYQGVEMDPVSSAAVAYHVQAQHPADDVYIGRTLDAWVRVPRETDWGRPIMVHAFEPRRAGEVRGVSPLAPIMKKAKQVSRYDEAELQAAILNAVMAAYVESLGGVGDAAAMSGQAFDDYYGDRAEHYTAAPIHLDGVQISYGYPGDKLTLTKPGHPNSGFEAFQRAALRNISSTMGISYEQLTMDWSQVNYSSARAALVEVWRGLTARQTNFAAQFMAPWYAAWLEEAIAIGAVVPPKRAKSFAEARSAYVAAEWIPPGRGWVDPLKEVDAAVARMGGMISTLADETAQQGGDWKKKLRQRAREDRFLKDLGLTRPEAARAAGGYPSDPAAAGQGATP